MDKEENIKLSELLEVCLKFKKQPTDTNEIIVKSLVNKMVIRKYTPLTIKQLNLVLILSQITERMDAVEAGIQVEIGKIIYGLLPHVVNLVNDLDRVSGIASVVDILHEQGIVDYIKKYCLDDYVDFCNMVQNSVHFSNIERLSRVAALLDRESLEEFTNSIYTLKEELTPEKLEMLKSLAVSGSEEFKVLKETIADEVLGDMFKQELNTLLPEDLRKKEDDSEQNKDNGEEKTEESQTEEKNVA